ncbi:MAG: hypothetical protein PF569_03835 [Candidatus Woesearchaeota archaeon]|jgi:predicted patatin/cPLA2 family phospholipase|nr:hypothetical protein [Candidatus Woesearchaeota archaeon]
MSYNRRPNRQKTKKAIFDMDTDKRISGWWRFLSHGGVVNGESDFYVAGNTYFAIFHKSGKRISDWALTISSVGLVDGTSNQYRAELHDGEVKTFIFDRTEYIVSILQEELNAI